MFSRLSTLACVCQRQIQFGHCYCRTHSQENRLDKIVAAFMGPLNDGKANSELAQASHVKREVQLAKRTFRVEGVDRGKGFLVV